MRRLRLKNASNVYKYLAYAVGEIVLVVVGILIALQVDDHNEAKKDREQERQILLRLTREYDLNLSQLQEKIQMRNTLINSAFRILESTDNPSTAEFDTIVVKFQWLMKDPTFDPIKNDVIGTSNMRLILNDSLRLLLTNWESDVYQLQEVELQWQKVRSETIIPFTIQSGLARLVHNEIWKKGYTPVGALDKDARKTLMIGEPKGGLNISGILRGDELEGIAATAITMNQICNMQAAALEKRIRTIMSLLQREVRKAQ